jgi:hypothetical protein
VRSGNPPTERDQEPEAEAHRRARRFPGHLRAETPLAQTALHLLLKHYDAYQPFVDDCARVKQVIGEEQKLTSLQSFEDRIRAREALSALAQRWNLDRVPHFREHNHWHLQRALDQVGRRFGKIIGRPFSPISTFQGIWEPEDPMVAFEGRRWGWRLGSCEALGELRDRIAEDLDVVPSNLPSEVVEQLRSLPDQARHLKWKLTDLPHNLPTHVRWLFLRLCPQPDRPLGIAKIAGLEDPMVDERTVRRAVKQLAEAMRIQLPPLRVGRPRRDRRLAASN